MPYFSLFNRIDNIFAAPCKIRLDYRLDGMTVTQLEETSNGIPIWMECAIYRKDRSRPIMVREYFEESKES